MVVASAIRKQMWSFCFGVGINEGERVVTVERPEK